MDHLPYILTIWKVLKVSVRARFNYMSQLIEQFIFPVLKHLHISLFANTIVIWDKCNCAIGQIQLQKEQESCIGCVQKSHGLKHLCVFPSLLEFQPPPIFLPIELSYCIIAMHWNGSFPRIVFLSHSFPPLITIQQAQHTHRSNLFWPRTFDIVWIPLFICSETYWKYTLWAPRMLWTTLFSLSLSSSYFCFALHCTDFAPQRVRGICKRISSDAVQMDLSPNKSQVCLFRSDITKSS